MKKLILISGTILAATSAVIAQDKEATEITITAPSGKQEPKILSIGGDGVFLGTNSKLQKRNSKKVSFSYGNLELGLNNLIDNSKYEQPNADLLNSFSNVDQQNINEDFFDLKNGKSWFVNIYPVAMNVKLVRQSNFKIDMISQLGLQVYNFRFQKDISYLSVPTAAYTMDNIKYSKNKLSINYLNIPILFRFSHKVDAKNWISYGAGATFGYRLSSWTKQVSSEHGKVKNHDGFNLNDFNATVNAEIGYNKTHLFASYQLTNIYKTSGLIQQPISFGVRFY